jgi:DNA uptake protein ComE-like DNA-binding protein
MLSWEDGMKTYAMMVVMAAAVMVAGCVSKDKYVAATTEVDSIRADLEKTRAQKSALDQQVKSLKDANAKLTADSEFMSAELQRIKDSRDKERSNIDTRTKDLEQKLKEMTAHQRMLKQEYEDVKKHNETLKSTVARYQKELKERERSIALPTPPALPKSPTAAPTPVPSLGMEPAPPAGKAPPAAMSQPAAPSAGIAPVNVNTASPSDLVLFLGLTKDMAERVVANRPYKIKGELVAKNIMPKATFDLLKDRITVAQ